MNIAFPDFSQPPQSPLLKPNPPPLLLLLSRVLSAGGERLQEASAAGLRLKATMDAEPQPVGVSEFAAMTLVNATGKQVESGFEKARGK
jgi:hypothetical protein